MDASLFVLDCILESFSTVLRGVSLHLGFRMHLVFPMQAEVAEKSVTPSRVGFDFFGAGACCHAQPRHNQ